MTFSEFKQTDFYAWHENWYSNNPLCENIEDMMKALYCLSFRDKMMKHFEENSKLYGEIIYTTSMPRLHYNGVFKK